jgi:hypothetical protein
VNLVDKYIIQESKRTAIKEKIELIQARLIAMGNSLIGQRITPELEEILRPVLVDNIIVSLDIVGDEPWPRIS